MTDQRYLRPPRAIDATEGFDDEIRAVVHELLDAANWVVANRGYFSEPPPF